MNRNEQWLNMLTKLNIEPDETIKNGELISKTLLTDNKSWRLTLSFEQLIPQKKLAFLMEKIKKYLIEVLDATDCKFTIIYRNQEINDDYVVDYLKDGIEVLSKVSKEILMLNRYQFSIYKGLVTICVANDIEAKIINAKCELLKKYLDNYGLNNVRFEIVINDEEQDLKSQHEKNLEITELTNIAKGNEEYEKRKLSSQDGTNIDNYTGI